MSDAPKKQLQTFRTFAKDLAAERAKKNSGSPVPEPEKTPTPTENLKPADQPKLEIIKPKETPKEIPKPQEHKVASIPKFTVPTPPEPKKETKIPAFHELNKHSSVPKPKHENIVAAPTHPRNRNVTIIEPDDNKDVKKPIPKFVSGGTIITDTKESSFKLLPSIISSIKKWFEDLSRQRKNKKKPTYTIPETNRRKGVIQRATSKTGTIFTADSDTIKEQIRRRRQQEVSGDNDKETSWSPFTETGFNLLEAPHTEQDQTKNVKVEFKKQAKVELPTPTPPPPPPPVKEVVPPQVIEPTPKPITIIEPTPSPIIEEPIPEVYEYNQLVEETEPEKFVNEEVINYEPEVGETIPQAETADQVDYRQSKSGFLARIAKLNTNSLALIILMVIVGIVVIIFSIKFIFQHIAGSPEPIVIEKVVKRQLLPAATQFSFVVTEDDGVKQFNTAIESAPEGLIEISLLTNFDSELKTENLFNLFDFHAEPNLVQSIATARFAALDHKNPALILGFSDEETVRGGLLKWEATLGQDMSALLKNKSDSSTKFEDVALVGFDVRVLKVDGETELVYGIVNHNTVIITTSEDSFSQIIKLGFSDSPK